MIPSWKNWLVSLFLFLNLIPASFAGGLSEIGVGGSYSAAMGSAYTALGKAHPFGLEAMASLDLDTFAQIIVSQVFQKYDLANVPSPGASIYLLGTFGGLQFRSSGGAAKNSVPLEYSFSAQLGATYDWLMISSASTTNPNAGMNLATRFSPGIGLSLGSALGVGLDFPIMLILLKSPIAIWSSTLSLKWKFI